MEDISHDFKMSAKTLVYIVFLHSDHLARNSQEHMHMATMCSNRTNSSVSAIASLTLLIYAMFGAFGWLSRWLGYDPDFLSFS